MPGAAKLGSCTGLSASNASPAHIESSTPPVPPRATTHALSDNISRTNRPSSAPIARLSENSRRRDSVRARSRLATLAHAITSTNATAPNNSEIAGRIWPKTSSARDATSIPRASLVSRYSCSRALAMVDTSACAALLSTPGASTARALNPRPLRLGFARRWKCEKRHPRLGVIRTASERGRHHTNDGVGKATEAHRAADRVGIARVGAFPQALADHRNQRRADRIVGLCQRPSNERFSAKDREVVVRHGLRIDLLWSAVAVANEVDGFPRRDLRERPAAVSIVDVVGNGQVRGARSPGAARCPTTRRCDPHRGKAADEARLHSTAQTSSLLRQCPTPAPALRQASSSDSSKAPATRTGGRSPCAPTQQATCRRFRPEIARGGTSSSPCANRVSDYERCRTELFANLPRADAVQGRDIQFSYI